MTGSEAKELDYGVAMSINALVRAMGMQAENERALKMGHIPVYGEVHFMAVLEQNGIYHNSVLSRWDGL